MSIMMVSSIRLMRESSPICWLETKPGMPVQILLPAAQLPGHASDDDGVGLFRRKINAPVKANGTAVKGAGIGFNV